MHHPHRAWAVCAGGAIMLFTVLGLGLNVFSVYQPYIIALNHFSNVQGAWINTTRSLFILFGMMSANWICTKLGLRWGATFSLLLLTVSYVIFGFASSFPVYCVGSALSGLSYSWGGMVPLSLLINRWFQDQQTFALGLSAAGSGLATIVAPGILTWIIEHQSMSAAFWWEGAFIALMAALVFVLVRDDPQQLGLSPYRSGDVSAPPPPLRSAPPHMSTRRWWLIWLSVFIMGGPTSLGVTNVGVLYATEGYTPGTVAALVSTMGICLIVGKLIFGRMVDRLGGRRSSYIIFSVILVSYLLCCMAATGLTLPAYGAMAIFGLGLPVSNVALSVWAKDFGGDEGFARGLKWCQTMYALGILVCSPLPGVIADATGSYVGAYFLFFLMMVISMALVAWVYQKTKAGAKPKLLEKC